MKSIFRLSMGVILLGSLVFAAGGASSAPAITGTWSIEPSRSADAGTVNLEMRRRSGHSSWSSGDTVPVSSLVGLDPAVLREGSAPVRFEVRRDAGVLRFEGSVRNGEGAGHFSFEPDAGYAAEMEKIGYGSLDGDRLFSLAVHDVNRAFLRDLSSLGFARIALDDAIAFRVHGATIEYIRALQELGYRSATPDQIVAFRIHGATAEYIRAMQEHG